MSLNPGSRLGVYEIKGPIGAGGMGEVYRALDTRLARDVAIKVLPEALSGDAERLARFEREAQLLAALDHPHIARIYGLDEADGVRFLAMELAEGEDLSAVIQRGALPVDDAITIAAKLAAGLESAHESGIIHRDLKPANIKVGSSGDVKILDFGLARAYEGDAAMAAPQLSQSPTITGQLTTPGIILGTAAYMSPEQARGRPVDRRADIWAFGVVFYEMLTGRQLFAGETISEVLASVIKDEPDFDALPASLPGHVRRLIERCLTRDPRQRLRDIGEARVALESAPDMTSAVDTASPAKPASSRRRILAIIAVALVAAFAAWVLKPSPAPAPLLKIDMIAEGIDEDWMLMPTLSPDGSRMAYTAKGRVWVRHLDEIVARPIADIQEPSSLFWSPDGEWVAYQHFKKLWKVPATGGTPVTICQIPETGGMIGGSWRKDDVIALAVWRGALYEVPVGTGRPTPMFPHDPETQIDYHWPSWMPNGDLIFSPHWRDDVAATGPRPLMETFDGTHRNPIEFENPHGDFWPSVTQDGYIVFLRGRETSSGRDLPASEPGLWAAKFDADTRSFRGEPFRIAANAINASVANNGSLLYMESSGSESVSEMGWVDRSGEWIQTIGKPHVGLSNPALSPDEQRVAFQAGMSQDADIWLLDLRRDVEARLTFETADETNARWFPSSDRLAFASRVDMHQTIVVLSLAGSGEPVPLNIDGTVGAAARAYDIAQTAGHIAVVQDDRGRGRLHVSKFQEDGTAGPLQLLLPDPQPDVGQPRLSPDGRLIAYLIYDSGQPELFLSRFPDGTGKWQISRDGARNPAWSRSGELFFVAGSGPTARTLTGVTVDPSRNPVADAPVGLFAVDSYDDKTFDVSADGRRFLFTRRSGADTRTARRMILVQNWRSEFPGR